MQQAPPHIVSYQICSRPASIGNFKTGDFSLQDFYLGGLSATWNDLLEEGFMARRSSGVDFFSALFPLRLGFPPVPQIEEIGITTASRPGLWSEPVCARGCTHRGLPMR